MRASDPMELKLQGSRVASEARGEHRSYGAKVAGVKRGLTWVLGTEEQQVLLTAKPSLQPISVLFFFFKAESHGSQPGLKLTLGMTLSIWSACPFFPHAGMTGMHHHAMLCW